MLADLAPDEFKRLPGVLCDRRRRRIAPIRGQLGSDSGRTYGERWVVIDTKVLQEWPGHDRLRFHCNPTRPPSTARRRWVITAGSSRPATDEDERPACARTRSGRSSTSRASPRTRQDPARGASTATTSGSPTGGGWAGSSWPVTPRTRCRRGSARACPPGCATWPTCAGSSPPCSRTGAGIGARLLPGRAAAARHGGDQPRVSSRQAHHRAQPRSRGRAQPRAAALPRLPGVHA